jgi:hypothetical protein
MAQGFGTAPGVGRLAYESAIAFELMEPQAIVNNMPVMSNLKPVSDPHRGTA